MIGKTISHYKILEKLGEGGMGIVYKAEDNKLGRFIVLKFLSTQIRGDPEVKRRFIHEAKAAAALNHPNICTVYEIDEVDGQLFIAMEFVEGQSLQEIVNTPLIPPRGGTKGGVMPSSGELKGGVLNLRNVLDYATQIAEGLQAAHEKGVIHRDIKPANIMVTPKEQVKIMDFGLAKLTGRTKLTQTGTTLGTAAYMSPEQVEGRPADARTDLWSFGAVLYEMITGQVPFQDDYEAAVMYAILNESPTPPGELREELPNELERIILKCLRKEAKDRHASAQVLLRELKKIQRGAERAAVASEVKEKRAVKPESERRQTTVLCVTISGYNEMLEALDPEEAANIMNLCFQELRGVAQRYQGTVDQITGNRVRVLFGLPKAIEAAPQKAVNAAIAMRKRLREFYQDQNLKIPLDVQIGIDTGIVITGVAVDGDKEFTFMGQPVALSEQLTENASKGQVFIGPLTNRYTRNDFEFKEVSPITLKGKTEPVAVFELLSSEERLAPMALGAERMIFSEMIGRDKELDKLKLQVLKAINGEGSIVTVIGEAGIGKSRLVAELRQLEDVKKVALQEGRALSIGKNLSYHPIIDIIKNRVGITEKDGDHEAQGKLERAIREVYPEGLDEVFPFLATLMGMKLTGKHAERVKGIEGEAMEKLILKNLRELMMKGAERRPIVYILQDLHWADQTSIELLQSLYRLAESHPICFINVLRPNYPETSERLLATIKERYPKVHVEIALEPLNDNQCDTLIQNLLKASGIPTELRSTIAQKAEGNPFFIEEVVRSFIDEGALLLENGKFKVTEKIDAVVIPETIQDVLMTRIDRLDEETKSLLKHASVIGRYFFHKILAEVAKTIEDMDERLEYLQGVQLILEGQRMEELEYLFKHVLAQEVTYESILLKKRKELHLQVANAIESVFNERLHEFYGMLALHYSKGENLEKAEEYLVKAGEEALKSAASSEALNYYQEALKFYLKKAGANVDSDKMAMLEKNVALAFYNKGHMTEAVIHFDKALHHFGEKIPESKIVQVSKFLLTLLSVLKNLYWPSRKAKRPASDKDIEILDLRYKKGVALSGTDAKRMFMENIGLIHLLDKFDLTKMKDASHFYSMGGALFSLVGIFSISQKFIEVSKELLREKESRSMSTFKSMETLHNFLAGLWDRAHKIDDETVNTGLRLGDLFQVFIYIACSCDIAIGRGAFDYAKMVLNKQFDIIDTFDYDLGRIGHYIRQISYRVHKRQFHDISKFVETGIAFANKLGERLFTLRILGIKAKAQILLGDLAGAEESLSQAADILVEAGRVIPYHSKEYFMTQFLFDVYQLENFLIADLSRGDKTKIREFRKKAHKSGKDAIKLSRKVAEKQPEALRLMGIVYWLENRQKQALKYWDESINSAEHLGARPELARTYLEVGKRLLEPKSKTRELNGISAEGYLEKAQALFEEMELQWDLEQLENVRRTSEACRT